MLDNNLNKEEATSALKKLFKLKSKLDKATERYNQMRFDMANYMQRRKLREFVVQPSEVEFSEPIEIKAKLVERVTSLKYDPKALKEKLGKDRYSEVVDKTYIITDIEAMISLVKNAGVDPKAFKKLVQVVEEPNKAKIQQLFSVGDITTEQLQGTYTATISKSVQVSSSKLERKGDSD